MERGERRVVGVTVEGVPVTLHVPEPHRFGTELVRRTGAKDYVEALGPLPDGLDEAAVYDALGVPWCPPELREAPFAVSRRSSWSSRTSAGTCIATRPGQTGRRR